jgi:outer membrane protein
MGIQRMAVTAAVLLSMTSIAAAPVVADVPAVSASDQALSLSIQSAVKTALDRNPTVATSREQINQDDKNISFAISQVFPSLVGTGSATQQKDAVLDTTPLFGGSAYNNYSLLLKVNQPLWDGGAILAGWNFAKKDKEIKLKNLEIAERSTILQVIQAFYSVLLNRENRDLLQQTLKVEQESLTTTERYYKIGRLQLLDVLQARTNVALLLPQIATAENQMKAAASQLTSVLHENQAKSVNLTGSLAAVDMPSIMDLLPLKRELPEIAVSRLTISQFEDTIDVQMAPNNPSASFQAGWGDNAYVKSNLLDQGSTSWSFGLFVTIPIFSGLSSYYQKAALLSQQQQNRYAQQTTLDTLSFNQVQSERDLDTAMANLKSAKSAADLGAASLKEAQRDFRLQTINYIQLLTSQQTYLQAESSFVTAEYSYISAIANYFVASGIPLSHLVDVLEAKSGHAPST